MPTGFRRRSSLIATTRRIRRPEARSVSECEPGKWGWRVLQAVGASQRRIKNASDQFFPGLAIALRVSRPTRTLSDDKNLTSAGFLPPAIANSECSLQDQAPANRGKSGPQFHGTFRPSIDRLRTPRRLLTQPSGRVNRVRRPKRGQLQSVDSVFPGSIADVLCWMR